MAEAVSYGKPRYLFVMVTPADHQRLTALGRREHQPVSRLLREAVNDVLESFGEAPLQETRGTVTKAPARDRRGRWVGLTGRGVKSSTSNPRETAGQAQTHTVKSDDFCHIGTMNAKGRT